MFGLFHPSIIATCIHWYLSCKTTQMRKHLFYHDNCLVFLCVIYMKGHLFWESTIRPSLWSFKLYHCVFSDEVYEVEKVMSRRTIKGIKMSSGRAWARNTTSGLRCLVANGSEEANLQHIVESNVVGVQDRCQDFSSMWQLDTVTCSRHQYSRLTY